MTEARRAKHHRCIAALSVAEDVLGSGVIEYLRSHGPYVWPSIAVDDAIVGLAVGSDESVKFRDIFSSCLDSDIRRQSKMRRILTDNETKRYHRGL